MDGSIIMGEDSTNCYTGWKNGVKSLFNGVGELNGITHLPKDATPDEILRGGFSMAQHRVIFDTCYWRDRLAHHDGVCSYGLSTPDVHCVKFNDSTIYDGPDGNPDSHGFEFALEDARVVMPTQASDHTEGNIRDNTQEQGMGVHRDGKILSGTMDVYDVLSYSSLAYAEANAIKDIIKNVLKRDNSRPPVIMTPERNFRGCDAGGMCNLPLS